MVIAAVGRERIFGPVAQRKVAGKLLTTVVETASPGSSTARLPTPGAKLPGHRYALDEKTGGLLALVEGAFLVRDA